MAKHGNSLDNEKEHHLYAIHDRKEKDIFKYGISDKPIGKDGYSSRMREQINFLNAAVGIIRYVGEILIKGIIGRKKARQLEDEHIKAYERENGRKPRGNRR
ncbi:MAG: hypothetical protein ACE362_25035 [Phaeodactylibacter xiamenensis]|uniref:Tox-URI2 domain-containing protein n=1 Tax=Phaeodactylibacter xiamenensis TaxID=1524460 RepID=A0A098S3A7_9BACT|nr:hypothetical protein [Phaeodactylibacter xiamenensis]KGE86630.1 hypothetical protein IX84_20290 [Phaeodactylibacter xiamenensis]